MPHPHSCPVGRLAAIHRHPVKSMRGESLDAARLYWHGLEGDRRFAFLLAGDLSRFPWFTAREHPELIRYVPRFEDPSDPVFSPVLVRCPDGAELPLDDPALHAQLEARSGKRITLMQLGRGAVDSMAVSLISTATLAALGEAAGLPTDGRRFRINLVIEPYEATPFIEEQWLDRSLTVGEGGARLRLVRQIERCMVVNLDPDTARQDPAVLRAVVRERGKMAGIFGTTEAIGPLAVGDELWLSEE